MEQQPHNPHDPDNRGPEHERLYPSEIDLTGSVDQPDALRDVIWDAIAEVEHPHGEIPEWGARTIARALANRLGGPGALHHFAVTGRLIHNAMISELIVISVTTNDEEIHEWINHLGKYVTKAADTPDTTNQTAEPSLDELRILTDVSHDDTALEKIRAYLRVSFAAADAKDGAIPEHIAQVIAVMLAPLLPPDSEVERLLRTGHASRGRLHEECEQMRRQQWPTPDVGLWVDRFEQYLTAKEGLADGTAPRDEDTAKTPDNAQAATGIRDHGDAFRAYLQLSDTDPTSSDLLERFNDFYIGSFKSIEAVLDQLTEFPRFRAAIQEAEQQWGFEEYVSFDHKKLEETVRATWDIVELDGKFYVFMR